MNKHSAIPADIWERVQRRLDEVETRYGIMVLHAVESGSRAWGFPSPDSDYDVRFIYRHPTSWYVSVFEDRDVVDEGVDDLAMDVSGWDFRKTLRLLLKSNPPLYEWLTSPIVYRTSGDWASRLRGLCETVFERRTLAYHYRSIALNQRKGDWPARADVNLKKYFYIIRPLCALEWLKTHPGIMPPMNLRELTSGIEIPPSVRAAIAELLERKKETSELGAASPIPELENWIDKQLVNADALCENLPATMSAREKVDSFYRETLGLTLPPPPVHSPTKIDIQSVARIAIEARPLGED